MKRLKISLTVNEESVDLNVLPNQTLLEALRDILGYTGTKEGCGEGSCGACTVLMDGRPVRACLTLAAEADTRNITTVEGLARDREPSPLQQAFIDQGAVQCGFCTPGMLMASEALLRENSNPDEAAIKRALSGNICRCTGYTKIIEAVASTARTMP